MNNIGELMSNIFNTNHTVKSFDYPFNFWIIDQVFDENFCQEILRLWPSQSDERWNRGYDLIDGKKNRLEGNMLAMSGKQNMPEFFRLFLTSLNGASSIDFYEKITSVLDLKIDDNWRWAGLRETLPGGYQLIHSDARQHPESGLRKELTFLCYFRDSYKKESDEGCLEVWSDDMSQMVHAIEPIHNRMVIFQNTDKSYHGVPETKANRKAITFSMLKEGPVAERSKAFFVGRPDDDQEISELGLARLTLQDRFNNSKV